MPADALLLIALLAADYDYARLGNDQDAAPKTRPGFALLGGGKDVDEAFRWMIERAGGGDFLVLRASGTPAYNEYVRGLGPLNSTATLILRTREASSDDFVLRRVREAEAIFLAGGDQWNYIRLWKASPLQKALQDHIDAGKPIGGTSAGLAVLGEFYFSAQFDTITSAQALADPYDPRAAVGSGFLRITPLAEVITDSHFAARSRQGRLAVFLARLIADRQTAKPRGLGIDEATAVLMEADGTSRVVGRGAAWWFEPTQPPEACHSNAPLTLRGLRIRKITAQSAEQSTVDIVEGRWP